MNSKEDIPMDERVRLMNLFYPEMGIRIRAKKHLTIGYTYELMWDFVYRAYELGKQQAADQVREAAFQEACFLLCPRCKQGDHRYISKSGNSWHGLLKGTTDTYTASCPASAIYLILDNTAGRESEDK